MEASEKCGLGKNIDVQLARKEILKNGTAVMYAINTNQQLELELPVAISNNDIIQGIHLNSGY